MGFKVFLEEILEVLRDIMLREFDYLWGWGKGMILIGGIMDGDKWGLIF